MGGSASEEIDAPLKEVWAVVEDVLAAPDWQGGVVSMSALEHDGDGRPTLVEVENDIKVRRVKTQVRFRYEPPARRGPLLRPGADGRPRAGSPAAGGE